MALSILWLGSSAQIIYSSEAGVLDLRHWDFNSKKIAINDYWVFFENTLLEPDDVQTLKRTRFNAFASTNTFTGEGFSTYALDILLPESSSELAFQLPQMYSSYNFIVNGEVVASNGVVAKTKEAAIPQWRAQVVSLSEVRDTLLHVVLQISNFHHATGGIKEPVYLGSSENLIRQHTFAKAATSVEVLLLISEATLFILIFFLWKKDQGALYFGLLCLSWSIRGIFSNLYLVTQIFPDFNWAWMVRIEYLMLFCSAIFGVLFLHNLFKNISNRIVQYILVGINVFFILYCLFSSPLEFTRWLPIYLAVATIVLVYGIVIVTQALILEQRGVWYLIGSIFSGVIIFMYDILSYAGLFDYNYAILSIGYVIIFMFATCSLLLHLDIIKSKRPMFGSMLTYEDFYNNKLV